MEIFSLLPFLAHRQQNEVPPQEELSPIPSDRESSAWQSLEPGEGAQPGTLWAAVAALSPQTPPSKPAHVCLHDIPDTVCK